MEVNSTGENSFVIEAPQLVDGLTANVRGDCLVVVTGDTIRSVGRANEIDIPSGDTVQRFTLPPGSTLIPGLIDTHTHLTMNGSGVPLPVSLADNDGILLAQAVASARKHMESGVTTVVDAGARGNIAFDLVQGAKLGLIDAPRLFVAGRPITRTGGHAWHMGEEADGPDGVRKAAREMLKHGADFIKVMATGGGTPGTYPHRPSYSTEELKVATGEAHEYGKLAVAHSSATEGHRRCLDAEIDIIYHCHFYEPDGTLRFDSDTAKRIAQSETYVNPTLWVNGGRLDALRKKAQSQHLTDEEQRELVDRTERYAGQRENVGRLADAGVNLIAGTDAGFALYPFGDLVTELEEMVACGLSAANALTSATRLAAEALRLDDVVGSLAAGKKADLVVINGDPTTDISALREVQAVMREGDVVRNSGGLVEAGYQA